MSITPIAHTENKAADSKVSLISALPKDILNEIFIIIGKTWDVTSIGKIVRTCKLFRDHLYEKVPALCGHIFLTHTQRRPSHSFGPFALSGAVAPKLLAVSEDGKQFCVTSVNLDQILYILHHSTEECSFKLTRVDVRSAVKEPGMSTHYAQSIVACYPTESGFIVVTKAGVSVWEFINGESIFKQFYTPFSISNVSTSYIADSCYKNGILIVLKGESLFQKGSNLVFIDLNKEVPEFKPLDLNSVKVAGRLLSNGDKIYHSDYKNETEVSLQELDLTKISDNVALTIKGPPACYKGITHNNSLPSNKWMLLCSESNQFIQVIDTHSNTLWIGPKMKIRNPHPSSFGDFKEPIFLSNDFLLVTYPNGKLRAIYLPTKKDYTKKLQLLLNEYLEKGAFVYGTAFSFDAESKKLILSVCVQYHDMSITNYNFELEKPVFSKSTTFSPTCAKATIVVGAILLLLTIAAYISLRQFPSGSIVHLRIPSLVAGGTISLAFLVLGTYKFLKAKNKI